MSSRWRTIFHDVYGSYPLHLLLLGLHALADRILWVPAGRRPVRHLRVSQRNYLRLPALGSVRARLPADEAVAFPG